MILNIKKINGSLAIGLRWMVATYAEIEYLKDRSDLEYGFVHRLRERSKKNYKLAVLTSRDHYKAVSLAGVLSEKYENLIVVHKIQTDLYWVCVIKNHQVWNDVDVGDKTAGDLLCNREKAQEIVQIARDHFSEASIAIETLCFSTTQVESEFSHFLPATLTDLLEKTSKYGKYRIQSIKSHRKKIRQAVVLATIAVLSSVAFYYVYATQNDEARARAAEMKQALALQQELQRKFTYVRNLDEKIQHQQGASVIRLCQYLLGQLSFQSYGWLVTEIHYNASLPNVMNLSLSRGPYGDILSFHQAFSALTSQETMNSDNNSGSKLLKFSGQNPWTHLSDAQQQKYNKIVSSAYPLQRIQLISYTQKHHLALEIKEATEDPYHFKKSSISLSGNNLWNLRKLEYIFDNFPTLIVNNIHFTIGTDRTVAWQLEGEIYG